MRARGWIRLSAMFCLGLVAGAVLVAFLSMRASRLFVSMQRFGFETEQRDRLNAGLRQGDLEGALMHATCAMQGDAAVFDPGRSMWNPAFPLLGFFVTKATRFGADDEGHYLAAMHARRAVILERKGNVQEARRELEEAVRLAKADKDPEWWRRYANAELSASAPGRR